MRFGRKFFFITLCVEGRAKVLSRINPDATVILLAAGEAVAAAWRATHSLNPALSASNFMASPRAPEAASPRAQGAGFGAAEENQSESLAGFGAAAPFHWERRFWLVLSFSSRQLKAIRRYIKLNPARALWKARHPNRFKRLANIRHPILDASRQWDAVGNPLLLSSPFLFHVRLTRKMSLEEHRPAIDEIIEKARHGMIPVSGFLSPGEKEVLRRLKEEPVARFIKMRPCALPPEYDPSAEDSRELAADRMLILSGFPQSVADAGAIFRQNCLAMNDMAAAICVAVAQRTMITAPLGGGSKTRLW